MRLRKLMALALLLACIGGKSVAQTAPTSLRQKICVRAPSLPT